MWNNKNSIEDMIIFEDKDILVCHKAAGIAVQNARIGAADMESSLKNYLALKNTETVPYLGVVHRLDQPVEGVLVFAKNKKAAAGLTRQITTGNIVKEYLAVTDRMSEKHQGRLEDYLIKNGRTNTSEVVISKTSGAKKAVLDYEVIHQISDERTESGKRILIWKPVVIIRYVYRWRMQECRFLVTVNIIQERYLNYHLDCVPVI